MWSLGVSIVNFIGSLNSSEYFLKKKHFFNRFIVIWKRKEYFFLFHLSKSYLLLIWEFLQWNNYLVFQVTGTYIDCKRSVRRKISKYREVKNNLLLTTKKTMCIRIKFLIPKISNFPMLVDSNILKEIALDNLLWK